MHGSARERGWPKLSIRAELPVTKDVKKIDFFANRQCMREPIDEIHIAAELLDQATTAHLQGDTRSAEVLVQAANMPAIRGWTESLWGPRFANPDQSDYHRFRQVLDAPPLLPLGERVPVRMPNSAQKAAIVARYGRHCVFCHIPLISPEVRKVFHRIYPNAACWGPTNQTQHAAFQCMWLQFDHLLPHSRGGDNSSDNVVVTCAPCNFARQQWTLAEVGLVDPRTRPLHSSAWDGLERMLSS